MNMHRRLVRRVVVGTLVLGIAVLSAGCGDSDDAAAAPGTPWPGGTWTPPAETYGSQWETLSVKMSDGTILKADVSYPIDRTTGARATGNFPVLLTQVPYAPNPTSGDYFVQRGYIYVTMYVRGTQVASRGNGGSFEFFSDRDAQDGVEMVNWAATALQNSNGVVGLHGGSYMALTQFYTAAKLPAGHPVKAMQASCAGAEFYRETYFVGGIPTQTKNFQNFLGGAMDSPTAATQGIANFAEITAGGDKAYYRDFWKTRSPINYVQKIVDANIPIMLWGSNGDIYAQSSLELYAYLQNAYAKQANIYGPMSRTITPTGRYQVLISQGGHCANQDMRLQLEWFDTWLKGVNTGMEKTAMPIHVHELGSNTWLNTSHYPVAPSYTKYYLNASNALSTTAPTTSGTNDVVWAQPGPTSTVQFDGPALTSGATLAGPISASIYASSTTSNLMLIATLQQVTPNASGGPATVTELTSGAVMGSLAETDSSKTWQDKNGVTIRPYSNYDIDKPVAANTIQKYDFAISPRFVHLTPGSKLRVVLSTQIATARCPSGQALGTDACYPSDPHKASLDSSVARIYSGPTNSSSINLPLLKTDCWRSSDNPSVPFWGTSPVIAAADVPCRP